VSIARKLHHTYEDYLELERRSDVRHEYLAGEIYAMAGRTRQHAYLAGQVIALLARKLPPGCRVGTSDLKICIETSGLYTYPDAAVVCGPDRPDVRDPHAVTNPVLVVEVTSNGTEDYDRGAKLAHYQQVPSLECVVIVSHQQRKITVVARSASGWQTADFLAGGVATLTGPVAALSVDEIYSVVPGL
jgi:Uma2 family endonuclease